MFPEVFNPGTSPVHRPNFFSRCFLLTAPFPSRWRHPHTCAPRTSTACPCPAFGTCNQGTRADRFVAKLMHRHMSTEEADFAAEMAPGVGPTIACQGISSVTLQVTLSLFRRGS